MDILGIGIPELLVILVIALLVLGPERMVTVAKDVGRTISKVRREVSSVDLERMLEGTEKQPSTVESTPPNGPQVAGAQGSRSAIEPASMPSIQPQPPVGPVPWLVRLPSAPPAEEPPPPTHTTGEEPRS